MDLPYNLPIRRQSAWGRGTAATSKVMPRLNFSLVAPSLILISLLVSTSLPAQWPEWGGEGRDFRLDAEGFVETWPEAGPRLLWKKALGEGESAIVVDDQILYTMYRKDSTEVIVALQPEDGATLWEYSYEAPIPETLYVEFGDGPHATPVVAGERICTVGISGRLHCLDKASGKPLWSRDLVGEYGGRLPDCGYGSSPLVYKDKLLVQAGGKGHGVMAFALADGKVAWRSSDFATGYAAPLLIDVDGETQLVAFLHSEVAGFDPETGELLWSHPHPTEYGVNASVPVWGEDGILFISSAYDQGSRGLKLTRAESKTQVEELWHQRKLQVHFGNAQRLGDHVYATSGDFGPVFLVAADARNGKIIWQKRNIIGKATLLALDDALLMLDEKGKLVLASVTPKDVTVHAEHPLIEGRVWAPPTLVDRRLYARDRAYVYAFDLDSAPDAKPSRSTAEGRD